MMLNYKNITIVCCICCTFITTNAQVTDSLPATALQPVGRYVINKNKDVELISSAVHFGCSFRGTKCYIYASLPYNSGHNYLQYELDGKYRKKIRIEANDKQPVVITAEKAGQHTLWIYKTTEATSGAIIIQKITAKKIKPLQKSAAPIIEFIGNSITCGAAADTSELPCGTGDYHDHHNAYYAYGPRVARALGVDFILSSVSGIGVYRNWNSDSPTMPQVYEKVDFQEANPEKWNFKKFSPRVVSIALGTNDFSNGDGIKKRLPFDSAAFVSSYISFVQLVRSKYPNARIALLSSPVIDGASKLTLQNCLTAVKAKSDALYSYKKKVELYFFQSIQAHGCNGHPSVEDHAILAKELIPFFKKLLL